MVLSLAENERGHWTNELEHLKGMPIHGCCNFLLEVPCGEVGAL